MASLAVAGAASPADFAGEVAVTETSPAVAGAASLADIAEGVTVDMAPSAIAGVAFLADAGVASLAAAGVASLAVFAGSVAGVMRNLPVPVGSVSSDSQMGCGDCVLAKT